MTARTCDAHLLLPHATDLRALLLPAGDGTFALPCVRPDPAAPWQEVGGVIDAARRAWRAAVAVRRCVHTRVDGLTHRVSVYELENRNPAWRPPNGAVWVESAGEVPLASPEQKVWLGDWFKRQSRPVPDTRPDWYKSGWLDGLTPHLKQRLSQLGLRPVGEFEQCRTWCRSAILRGRTDEGTVYLKAVPPMFAHEAAIAGYLAARFPWHAPELLAVGPGRSWILMREFGRTLDKMPDARLWIGAIAAFSRLQVSLADQADTLAAVGVPVRPVADLPDQADALFAELEKSPGRLLREQVRRLLELRPAVRAACDELACYRLPVSLDHGDFWPGQVVVEPEAPDADGRAQFRFVDWSDAALTHPFFSFLYFADTVELAQHFADPAPLLPRFLDAYLDPWTPHEPPARLRAAMAIVQKLAPLHHALTYVRHILPNIEQQWEMRPTVDMYLRRLLERWEA